VLRGLNFGRRALRDTPSADGMAREIARYDPADATEVSRQIRAVAGEDALVDRLVAIYEDVIAQSDGRSVDTDAELRAASAYLRLMSAKLHERDLLKAFVARLLRVPV